MNMSQVVGPVQQALAYEWTENFEDEDTSDRLFYFIFRERAVIKLDYWDANLDLFVEHGTNFVVTLKKSRIYRSFKQTPVHLSGTRDQEANERYLIHHSECRGKKVRLTLHQPEFARWFIRRDSQFLQHSIFRFI